MTGYEYEVKCAKLLESKGFTKVTVTPGSGDQGVDIIAYKGGKKFGVQCKYYEGSVGNKAVQEVFAGAGFYGCDEKLVITNSTLTRPAMELAQKLGVQVWERVDAVYIQQNSSDYIKRESYKKKTAEKQNERKRIVFQNKIIAEFEKWKAEYCNLIAEHGPDMIQIEKTVTSIVVDELVQRYSFSIQTENDQLRKQILLVLSAQSGPKTCTEVMQADSYIGRFDSFQVLRMLIALTEAGNIDRTERRGKAYFSVPDLAREIYLSDNPYSFLSHCDSEKALALIGTKRLLELAATDGINN